MFEISNLNAKRKMSIKNSSNVFIIMTFIIKTSLCASTQNFTIYNNLSKFTKNNESIFNKDEKFNTKNSSNIEISNKDQNKNKFLDSEAKLKKKVPEMSFKSKGNANEYEVYFNLAIVRIYDLRINKIQYHYQSMIKKLKNLHFTKDATHFLMIYDIPKNYEQTDLKDEKIFNRITMIEIIHKLKKQKQFKYCLKIESYQFAIEICKIEDYFFNQEGTNEMKNLKRYESKIFMFFDQNDKKLLNDDCNRIFNDTCNYLSLELPSRHISQLDFIFFYENHNVDQFVKSLVDLKTQILNPNENVKIFDKEKLYYQGCDFVFFRFNQILYLFFELYKMDEKNVILDYDYKKNLITFSNLIEQTGFPYFKDINNYEFSWYDENEGRFCDQLDINNPQRNVTLDCFINVLKSIICNECMYLYTVYEKPNFFKDVDTKMSVGYFYFSYIIGNNRYLRKQNLIFKKKIPILDGNDINFNLSN